MWTSFFMCIFLFKFPFYYSDIPIIYYFILKLNISQLLLALHNSVLNHQIYFFENLTILYITLLGMSVVFSQRQRLSVMKEENYRKGLFSTKLYIYIYICSIRSYNSLLLLQPTSTPPKNTWYLCEVLN